MVHLFRRFAAYTAFLELEAELDGGGVAGGSLGYRIFVCAATGDLRAHGHSV